MKWLVQRHALLAIRPDGSLFQLRWMAAMLRNCTSARYAINKERMMRVAEYSRDCLRELRTELVCSTSSAGARRAEPAPCISGHRRDARE